MIDDDRDLFEQDDDESPFSDAAEARRRQVSAGEVRPGGREALTEETRATGGRPRGSLNRKTKDFERYYAAKGFKDPLVAMAEFLTADPVELQAWFIEHERTVTAVGKGVYQAAPSLMDIIKEQHAMASQLGPYLHGKKPIEVAIIDERLPHLTINLGTNQLDQARQIEAQRALSAGSTIDQEPEAEPSEINDLEEGGE